MDEIHSSRQATPTIEGTAVGYDLGDHDLGINVCIFESLFRMPIKIERVTLTTMTHPMNPTEAFVLPARLMSDA